MNWWNAGLFLVLAVGHAQLWVALINRLHARPLGERFLKQVRHLHDAAILTFPVLLVWFIGLNGPHLLTYGQWSDVSPFWACIMAACAMGSIGLAISIVRHHWRPVAPVLSAERSETIDMVQELGRSPIADGPYRWMATLPGNEQFSVELSEKHLALPRLPSVWDGLRILHLSDWHLMPTLDRSFFEAVTEHILARPADLVVFTGDLIDDIDCLAWLAKTVGRIDARLGRYFILGNHDWALDAERVRQEMSRLGWRDVAGRTFTIEFEGRRLVLGGDETPWIGQSPEFTLAAPDDFRLLLSHTPDHFRRAQREGVDLMLAGHVHGGQVVLPGIGPVYAPSRYGVRYAEGIFLKRSTVMHVSRGLSGDHPFRLRCPPELTWLVLEQGTV